jgi:alpha-tubulin suppressor-like RCC1 family protein
LLNPAANRFPWNLEAPFPVVLKDPKGAVVSPITCQADTSLVAVRSDCSRIAMGRLGAQSITVTGGGYSSVVIVQGVPQRHWSGLRGAATVSGDGYGMANLPDGTVASWGSNNFGVLGQNTPLFGIANSSVPRLVLDPTGLAALNQIYQVSAGDASVLALSEEGSVWGWGLNCYLAQAICGGTALLPVRVRNPASTGAISNVVQVESGVSNQVALQDDGTVWTWGAFTGQGDVLGKLLPGSVKTPDGKDNLGNIVSVSAGGLFSLALAGDGRVYAWGLDQAHGHLGAGAVFTAENPLPNTVKKQDGTELGGIVSISAGYAFSLALAADGTVWAWGFDQSQLGQNTLTSGAVPYAVQVKAPAGSSGALSNIVMVAAGGNHALALDSTGKVFAWGLATSGQLGDGPNRPAGNQSGQARAVLGTDGFTPLTGVVSIAASYRASSALLADGTVLMWGNNLIGALGRGDTANSNGLWINSPVPAPVLANLAKDPLNLGPLAAYPNLLRRAR